MNHFRLYFVPMNYDFDVEDFNLVELRENAVHTIDSVTAENLLVKVCQGINSESLSDQNYWVVTQIVNGDENIFAV